MDCGKCPLLPSRRPVHGTGQRGGIAVVGEAPGAQEVVAGQPFVGRAGKLLRATLSQSGIDPNMVYYTNACLCRPPTNPTPTMWSSCHDRLVNELIEVEPTKVLAVGGVALSALLGSTTAVPITKNRGLGRMVTIGEREVYSVSTIHPAAVLRNIDLFRDMQYDIQKFARLDAVLPEPDVEVVIISSMDELRSALLTLTSASAISCDLETSGFNPMTDRVLSIGFGALYSDSDAAGISYIIPWEFLIGQITKTLIHAFMSEFGGRMAFHNLKFDLQFLKRYFDEPYFRPQFPVDTMLERYLQDERPGGSNDDGERSYHTHGLKDIARVRYDIPDYHFDVEEFLAKPWEEREWTKLYHYQGLDCHCTIRLLNDIEPELDAESPRLLIDVNDKLLVPGALALSEVELNGVLVDQPRLESYREEIHTTLARQLESLQAIALTYGLEEFNPLSHPQARKLIFEKLGVKSKVQSTESDVIKSLLPHMSATSRKIVEELISYRQMKKIDGTYVTGLLERVDPDGRVRSDFLLHGTSTGRLSSRNPNLQNIPVLVGPMLRDMYISSPGYTLLECDYSQLELRIAAWYSGDAELIAAFKRGDDIHRIVASRMFKKPPEQITKFERYLAKYVDFGIIYGRGAASLVSGWEMEHLREMGGKPWTLREAEKFIKEFLDGFPGLRDWIEYQHKFVRKNGYIESALGRRRRFPLIVGDEREIGAIERQAVNTPIQGTASDLCLTALTRLQDRRLEWLRVLFEVHDAIYLEVQDDRLDEAVEIIQVEMVDNVPIDSEIPFPIDIKAGRRWGSAVSIEEWKKCPKAA